VFSTVAVPFDAYRLLPTDKHRWLLTTLARYTDKQGRCWPSMRQLAHDARMSLASVCRCLKSLSDLGVFQRVRKGVGRYVYTLAEAYLPHWPGHVSATKHRVSEGRTQEANPPKQSFKERFAGDLPVAPWEQRLKAWQSTKFWLDNWGPKPNEPGCLAPAQLLRATMGHV
jgi:hypothetical protein